MTVQDVVSTMNEGFFANLLSIDEKLHDQDDGENIQVMIRDDKNVPPEEKIMKDELIAQLAEKFTNSLKRTAGCQFVLQRGVDTDRNRTSIKSFYVPHISDPFKGII